MKGVIQRVSRAQVRVEGQIVGEIAKGILLLLGVGKGDTKAQADSLLDKIVNLRIFDDEQRVPNRSVLDIQGDVLLISQFTAPQLRLCWAGVSVPRVLAKVNGPNVS